jgi:hypothetical protein
MSWRTVDDQPPAQRRTAMGIVDGGDLGPLDPDGGLPHANLDHTQPAAQSATPTKPADNWGDGDGEVCGSRPREWCLSRPPRDLGLDFMR